jgi:hypothetical protein
MTVNRGGKLAALIGLSLIVQILAGCGRSDTRPPSAPSVVRQPVIATIVFKDPLTGLSTSDVRDAQNDVVQFNTAGELVWTADGTHLAGHYVQGPGYQSSLSIAGELSCACWLVVRFGASDGERRAYLTADYGHFNPGTLVALDIAGGALTVTATDTFPPGTYSLTGVVTEATPTGSRPLENASVYRLNEERGGWDGAKTDQNGFYEIRGLVDGSRLTGFSKGGYQSFEQADFAIHGDTRFDVQLVPR